MLLRRVLDRYTAATQKWPYRTNIAMAGFLWFSGDLISQLLEGKRFFVNQPHHRRAIKDGDDHSFPEPVDWARVLQMTSYGLFAAGPIYTWWYGLLDRKTLHLKTGKFPPLVAIFLIYLFQFLCGDI